jgi:hypothetical protein
VPPPGIFDSFVRAFKLSQKKADRMEFQVNLFAMQEFLGVLLLLAAFIGTMLVFGVALILFQEGIRRVVHGAKTSVMPPKASSAKDQWLQRAHGR